MTQVFYDNPYNKPGFIGSGLVPPEHIRFLLGTYKNSGFISNQGTFTECMGKLNAERTQFSLLSVFCVIVSPGIPELDYSRNNIVCAINGTNITIPDNTIGWHFYVRIDPTTKKARILADDSSSILPNDGYTYYFAQYLGAPNYTLHKTYGYTAPIGNIIEIGEDSTLWGGNTRTIEQEVSKDIIGEIPVGTVVRQVRSVSGHPVSGQGGLYVKKIDGSWGTLMSL